MTTSTGLTPKGERTREHILQVALELFTDKGYERATMRDIAAAAGCSLGLAYRYFARKEDLVLALYARQAQALAEQVAALPRQPLADNFVQTMQLKFALLSPYRLALGAIAGAALNPQDSVGVLGEQTAEIRRQVGGVFLQIVQRATDAPVGSQARELAALLYMAHFGLLLFWLIDRSPAQQRTAELLAFAHDLLGMVRRWLRLPPLARLLHRLVGILDSAFDTRIIT